MSTTRAGYKRPVQPRTFKRLADTLRNLAGEFDAAGGLSQPVKVNGAKMPDRAVLLLQQFALNVRRAQIARTGK